MKPQQFEKYAVTEGMHGAIAVLLLLFLQVGIVVAALNFLFWVATDLWLLREIGSSDLAYIVFKLALQVYFFAALPISLFCDFIRNMIHAWNTRNQ